MIDSCCTVIRLILYSTYSRIVYHARLRLQINVLNFIHLESTAVKLFRFHDMMRGVSTGLKKHAIALSSYSSCYCPQGKTARHLCALSLQCPLLSPRQDDRRALHHCDDHGDFQQLPRVGNGRILVANQKVRWKRAGQSVRFPKTKIPFAF